MKIGEKRKVCFVGRTGQELFYTDFLESKQNGISWRFGQKKRDLARFTRGLFIEIIMNLERPNKRPIKSKFVFVNGFLTFLMEV